MIRGWKQVLATLQREWERRPWTATLLGLLIAPLGCQEMPTALVDREPTRIGVKWDASSTPAAASRQGLRGTGPADAPGASSATADDSDACFADMVTNAVQRMAGVSPTTPNDLEAHPVARNVTRLVQQLSGEEPEKQRTAGDTEAMQMLAADRASASTTRLARSVFSKPSATASASRAGAARSITPVAYRVNAQTGGVVRTAALMADSRDSGPDSGPRKLDDLEKLPAPTALSEEEKESRTKDEDFSLPPTGLVIPKPCQTQLIDLSDAFDVAANQNPTIGLAQAEIGESVALLRRAQFLTLPTLRAGTNYHYHDGNFQASTGQIKSRDLQAFYIGGGARTLAAESLAFPMLQIIAPLTDAWFEPIVARAGVDRSRFHLAATNNQILMEVGDQYLNLVSAEARLLAVLQTEEELDEVVVATRNFREFGAGSVSDERRAQAEAALMRINEQRLQEEVAVASARLSRLLHLDPSVRLTTGSGPLKLFQLPPPANNLEDLIQIAVGNRPEVKEGAANVAMNYARLRRERARPLLPTLTFNYSAGSFGGGSNFYSTNKIAGNMGPRTDLDALAIWNLQNFGLGNLALQREARASINTAQAELSQAVNDVRREVTDSYITLQARERQLELARQRLKIAHSGFDHDIYRIRNRAADIKPIELLNSVTLLFQARQAFIGALVSFNQAQLDLFVRLGRPPTQACPEVQTLLMPDSEQVNEHKKQLRKEKARAAQAP